MAGPPADWAQIESRESIVQHRVSAYFAEPLAATKPSVGQRPTALLKSSERIAPEGP